MNPGVPLLRVGLPMVIATGVIQVLAQLAPSQGLTTTTSLWPDMGRLCILAPGDK